MPVPAQPTAPPQQYNPQAKERDVRKPEERRHPAPTPDRAIPRPQPPYNPTPDGAEQRHPRPDGWYNPPRPTTVYPVPHGTPWGPFGYPWWWVNSPYYWDTWDNHTTIIYREKEDKKVDKENYNIYRLATGTPVVLEDLIFESNVLGYCDDQLELVKELRLDYMKQFWEAAIKHEGNEDKIRAKQLDVLEDYKHDLKSFLRNEQPKCR